MLKLGTKELHKPLVGNLFAVQYFRVMLLMQKNLSDLRGTELLKGISLLVWICLCKKRIAF